MGFGIIFIFLGILLLIVGSIGTIKSTENKSNVKMGFGGFIGPFPFGFANDKKVLYILFGLGMLIFIIFEILRKT